MKGDGGREGGREDGWRGEGRGEDERSLRYWVAVSGESTSAV